MGSSEPGDTKTYPRHRDLSIYKASLSTRGGEQGANGGYPGVKEHQVGPSPHPSCPGLTQGHFKCNTELSYRGRAYRPQNQKQPNSLFQQEGCSSPIRQEELQLQGVSSHLAGTLSPASSLPVRNHVPNQEGRKPSRVRPQAAKRDATTSPFIHSTFIELLLCAKYKDEAFLPSSILCPVPLSSAVPQPPVGLSCSSITATYGDRRCPFAPPTSGSSVPTGN